MSSPFFLVLFSTLLYVHAQIVIPELAPECAPAAQAPNLSCAQLQDLSFSACGVLTTGETRASFCYNLFRSRLTAQYRCKLPIPSYGDVFFSFASCLHEYTQVRAKLDELTPLRRGLVYVSIMNGERTSDKLVYEFDSDLVNESDILSTPEPQENYGCISCRFRGVFCPRRCRTNHPNFSRSWF